MRRVIVGFSGGVTSAWCAGWALRTFPREEVTLLFHDTKEEHPDTYRFLHEMAAALRHPIVERSDGRSVTQLFRDEGYLGNNQKTFCSRILKAEQGAKYVAELRAQAGAVFVEENLFDQRPTGWYVGDEPFQVLKVIGYSKNERKRVQKMVGACGADRVVPVFPLITENITKQEATDWCIAQGVKPSAMYCWAEHSNCIGCVKGGRAYWIAVAENHPDVFAQRIALEEEFGHQIIRGGDRDHVWLKDLVQLGLKRQVNQREKIDIGVCDCGD